MNTKKFFQDWKIESIYEDEDGLEGLTVIDEDDLDEEDLDEEE